MGAASSPELKSWIFTVLNCIVMDGYGTTETGLLSEISQIHVEQVVFRGTLKLTPEFHCN